MESDGFSFLIGGEAGAGVARSGFLFAKACMRGGLHVFGMNDYQSLIRGGHNFYLVRASECEIYSGSRYANLLVALNSGSIALHKDLLTKDAGIIYDADDADLTAEKLGRPDLKVFPIPLRAIIVEELKQPHNLIMRNTVALGTAIAITQYDFSLLEGVLKSTFKKETAELNVRAARIGYDYAKERFEGGFKFSLRGTANAMKSRIFLSGNEAVGLGALRAGCRFFASYPMTPTTGLLHFMTQNSRDFRMIALQPEGEIAAINMAAGGAYAGARTMTSTSGGGFCLMSEGLGMTGMTETPVVIMVGQRPGPSTGLPTYTAQGDLRFVIHASQGEFPRVVVAPGDVEECFYESARAFNWAEKYQIPVILLADRHVLESEVSTEPFDVDRVRIERGLLIDKQYEDQKDYGRYEVTETGVSPRAIPSVRNAVVHANSDEHDDGGATSEEPVVTAAMMDKRMRKLHAIRQEMEENDVEMVKFYGPEKAEATVVSWGSTKGPIREAMKLQDAKGRTLNFLQVLYLQPFPNSKIEGILGKARRTIAVEHNSTSQLASLIREHTLRNVDHKIRKYDGRPFDPEELSSRIEEVL